MANGEVTQGRTRALNRVPAFDSETSQGRVRALEDHSSPDSETSQGRERVIGKTGSPGEVSQGRVRVLYTGRIDRPEVRAWTFTLDGHDFYVLRLGTESTLVYDTHTEQFYIWGSDQGLVWRAYTGINWLDGYRQSAAYNSNVVVGDDGNGAIYFLDPTRGIDDDALEGSAIPREYKRELYGQVAVRGYSSHPCYGIQLLGSIGDMTDGTTPTVSLTYSDDRGETYTDAGDITLTVDDFDARVNWRSLGSIRAPGRIFKITDYGALARIDTINMPGFDEES